MFILSLIGASKMYLSIITMNANGINVTEKQQMLHTFLLQYRIDILCLQEHN